jgi:hypothetical protein
MMPVSDVRGPPFFTTLEILWLFPYLAERQTFIAKLRSITRYFRPQCLGFDFGYLVRIERLSGKRRESSQGISKVKGKMVRGLGASRHWGSRAQVARAKSRKRQKHILIAHSRQHANSKPNPGSCERQ